MEHSLILLADSGSTKTDWLLTTENQQPVTRIQTQGINPFMQTDTEIAASLHTAHEQLAAWNAPTQIYFYGAGCRDEQCQRMREHLQQEWQETNLIEVGSDLLGAAKALFGRGKEATQPSDGIACILGTGSNSGLFLDGAIVHNVSPLGYILGDEGSGAVLGRRLLGDLLKHQLPQTLEDDFHAHYELTAQDILQRVYREPFANRFLASFAPFLHRHREEASIRHLLIEEFTRFFLRNIAQYNRPDLEVSFVGSIAFYFKEELTQAAHQTGFHIGCIRRSPLE